MSNALQNKHLRRLNNWCHSEKNNNNKKKTHKRFVHGSLDLVRAVAVDLLEDLVECSISLQLLVLLLLADVHHQLVPLASVMGRRWVLICLENSTKSDFILKASVARQLLSPQSFFFIILNWNFHWVQFNMFTFKSSTCNNCLVLKASLPARTPRGSHSNLIYYIAGGKYARCNPNKRCGAGGEM